MIIPLRACLAFAGTCLFAGAMVGLADWVGCVHQNGWARCEVPKADAMAGFSGAANVALAVALQERRRPDLQEPIP